MFVVRYYNVFINVCRCYYIVTKGAAIKRRSHQKEEPLKTTTKMKPFHFVQPRLLIWLQKCLRNQRRLIFPFEKIENFNPHHKTQWKTLTFSTELFTFHLSSSPKLKTRFSRRENLKICTSFEEQKDTRYTREKIYFDIILFISLSSAKPCLEFKLICFARKIKGFYLIS